MRDIDAVFITTPATTHFEICKFFLNQKINIFCEKPLTLCSNEAKFLYDLANKQNTFIFTDWIFIFHPSIIHLKTEFLTGRFGKIKNISMNRLNKGPVRQDVNARIDLAVHDVSIVQYLFNKVPKKIYWRDFKRNPESEVDDSTFGQIEYDNFWVQINASWEYPFKNRECIFEFEKIIIFWDDKNGTLDFYDINNRNKFGLKQNMKNEIKSVEPLVTSINTFFSDSVDTNYGQRNLTTQIIKIIEHKAHSS